jgi:hypothetical protein
VTIVCALGVIVALHAMNNAAMADEIYWDASTGNWAASTNWYDQTLSGAQKVPTSSDDAAVSTGTATISLPGATANDLSVSFASVALQAGGSLSTASEGLWASTLTQSGGSNTTNILLVGNNQGTGIYELDPGASLTVNVNETVGGTASGTFNQKGGTHTITDNLTIGGASSGGAGQFTMSSGTLTAGNIFVQGSGTNGTGELDIFNGTVTAGNLTIGPGGAEVVQLLGGALNVTGTLTVGAAPASEILQGGGSITAATTVDNGLIDESGGGGGTANLGSLTGSGLLDLGNSAAFSPPTFTTTVSSINLHSVEVETGGKLNIQQNNTVFANTINSLSITGTGTLDITNNPLLINYAGSSDPIATIKALIKSGYAGGAWTGAGITSSNAAANSLTYGIAYADSADPGNPAGLASGNIKIMYALLGDANLDGAVNGSDFAILAANFNKSVSGWDQGDFNYDGSVNGVDFAFLASNFNKGASQAANLEALDAFAIANGLDVNVPEPVAVGLIATATFMTLRRRLRAL